MAENNEIIDENEILVQQLEAEIAKLESEYNASQEGKGIAGGIGDLFSSCWNGITGNGFKNGDRVELDKKIELLKAAKSNPAKIAEAYKNIMGVELTDEVKQNAIEAQKVANSLSTEEKEAVADLLKEQAASLSELMKQTKDDQGWFSKTMGAINNVLGFGTNSIKADAQIEEYIKQVNSLDPNDPDFATKYQAITGEPLSFDGINELAQGVSKVGNSPAAEAIMDYEETQVAAKEIGSGIVTGVVTAICVIAAPFTGGASLLLGAAVGGATTVLINGTDTIGTSKKYSFEQGVLDFAGGAINGAVTAMTLGGAGLAGKGLSVLKGAGSATAKQTAKEMISGGFKNTVKTAFNGFGKAAWNGAKIAGMSSTANYLLNTVGTNALYEATGNYTKSESPANIVQNEDGTYSIYYALTDSNTGDLISYEIETLDSLSQDEEGNLIKGNILDVSRSNDFDFGDFAEQTIVSMGSAALGAGIGKITGNIINPYATSMTNSVILGNTAEIATDMTLSLGADYLIECARRGEIVDKDEFFSWDRILGEGQNQIRGLLIGIASTKANAIATDSVRAGLDGKSGTGTEIRLDGTSAPKTQQEVLESAGRLIIEENNPTKAVELLSTFGMSKTQIDAFVSEARSVMQETSSTCAVASVLNGVNNKNLLLERLSQKIQYDGTNDTYRINIGGEEVSVKLNQGDNPLQKVYEAYVEKYGDNPTTAIKVFDALFDDASDIIVRPVTGNIEQLREYIQDEKTILTFNTADGVAGLVKDHAYTVLEIDDAGNMRLQDPATLREFVISKEQYEGKDCQIEGKTYRDDGLVQDGVEAKMVAGGAGSYHKSIGHQQHIDAVFAGCGNSEKVSQIKKILAEIGEITNYSMRNDKNIIIRNNGVIDIDKTFESVTALHKIAIAMSKQGYVSEENNSVSNFLAQVIGGKDNNSEITLKRLNALIEFIEPETLLPKLFISMGIQSEGSNKLSIPSERTIRQIMTQLEATKKLSDDYGFEKEFIIDNLKNATTIFELLDHGVNKDFVVENLEHSSSMLTTLNHVLRFDGFNSQGNFDGFHNIHAHADMITKANQVEIGTSANITDILKSYAVNPDNIQEAGIKRICENMYEITVKFKGKKSGTIRYKRVEDPTTGIMILNAVDFCNADNRGLHTSIISQARGANGEDIEIDDVEAKYYFSAHPNDIEKVTARTIGQSDIYMLAATKNDGSTETIMFQKVSNGVGEDSFEVFPISARDMEFCSWCETELYNRIIEQADGIQIEESGRVTIEDFREFFGEDYNPRDRLEIGKKNGVYSLTITRRNGTSEVIKFTQDVAGTMVPAMRTPLEFTKGLIGKQELTEVFQKFYSSDFAPSQVSNPDNGISFNGRDYDFITYEGLKKLIVVECKGQKYIFSFNGSGNRYVCNTFFPISETYFNAMQNSITNGINVIELN